MRTQFGWVEQLEQRLTPSAGVLDPTFNFDGRVVTDFPTTVAPRDDIGRQVAIQQGDGKIVVAGDTSLSTIDLGLARYNPDGSLDNSFGVDGLVQQAFGSVSLLNVSGMALDASNNIIVVGTAITTDYDFFMARFTPDGNLDPAFGGGDGWLTTDFGGSTDEFATSVVIQSDGTIVVAGYSYQGVTGFDFALARYDNSGVNLSLTTTDFGSLDDEALGLTVDANGNIVVVGYSDQGITTGFDFAVARYDGTGVLDAGFGSFGLVLTDFTGFNDVAYSVAVQPADGMLVVAGSSDPDGSYVTDFALACYDSNGALDTVGFGGGDGLVTTDFGVGQTDIAFSVVVQPNTGAIVAGGYSDQGGATGGDFALTRYDGNGDLDTAGFGGGDGLVTTDFGSVDDVALSLSVRSDGGIVAAGRSYQIGGTVYDFAVSSYNSDGALDVNFDNDGKVLTNFSSAGYVPGLDDGQQAAITQPDGKIVVGGNSVRPNSTIHEIALSRYNDDGSLDHTFGNGGLIRQAFDGLSIYQVTGLALQADGKIVVVGSAFLTSSASDLNFFVARFNADGSVDPSFGTSGCVMTDFGSLSEGATCVAVDVAGKIVVAGYSFQLGQGNNFALARYEESGLLDGTFGTGGKVISDFNFRDDAANSIAIQDNGSIVAAGYTIQDETSLDFAIVRYTESGALDGTFGDNGWVTTDFNHNSNEIAYGVVVDHGSIIAVGYSDLGTFDLNHDFAIARYDSTGALDTNFIGDTGPRPGLVTTDFDSSDDEARSVIVQANGKIVVAGFSDQQAVTETGYDFALARYSSNGTLDTGFGAATTGKVTTDFILGLDDRAFSVTLQNDGKIVAAGVSDQFDPTLSDLAVARYDGDPIPASISGYVYIDANNNGLDGGEIGIENVSVTLTGSNDLGAIAAITITTDVNGFYSFGNLRPGTYTVTETQPAGYLDGKDTFDNVTAVANSNTTDALGSLTVGSGQADDQNNFGELQAASKSGCVYVDTNGNGIHDGGVINLGLARQFGVLGINGGDVTLNSAHITGSVGLGPNETASILQKADVSGTLTVDPTATWDQSNLGKDFLVASGVVTQNLVQAATDANTASVTAAALTADFVLGNVTANTTISATAASRSDGVTVASMISLNYNTDVLTLTGNATDVFVINVAGNWTYFDSQIALTGGLTADHVLFNFPNAGVNIEFSKATNVVNGTFLAPHGSALYHNPAAFNGAIIAQNIAIHSDANLNSVPLSSSGESCLAGATVTLTGTTDFGQSVNFVQQTTTAGYSFQGLLPGTYVVTATPPSGYAVGAINVGTINGVPDGISAPPNQITQIVLHSGDNAINDDFGLVKTYDFSDAPTSAQSGFASSYPTLLADNGARHLISSALKLGSSVDAETNGLPNATATGDNASNVNDEAGVSFTSLIETGRTATINVTVTGTGGYLNAWLDFNRDGDWSDAGEKLFLNRAVANGVNSLTFAVPAGTIAGDSFARFRLSTQQNLAPTGEAPDGEVEDYKVSLGCVNGPIGGVNLGSLPNYLFFFANGSQDANWQGATKGFAGDVAVNGSLASERTSGGVPYAGTIYTNDSTLGAWQNIITQNSSQAFASTGKTMVISELTTQLNSAFSQINALSVTNNSFGNFANRVSTSLNGLNIQNNIAETIVINVTSGFQVSSKINITGDASDVFILRWDTDSNSANGYQGQVKFQSGGAIVPLGGLAASNFIHVAGDINASGGGSNPLAPYPQGPRVDDGTGALISGGKNFSGGGFFTGYWLTTGDPSTGDTSSLSNAIFVGGWYTLSDKFSMTSGTSGVHVCPNAYKAALADGSTILTSSSGFLGSVASGVYAVSVDGLQGEAGVLEHARIDDAIAELNGVLSTFGVTLVDVGADSDSLPTIYIHLAGTSVIGGVTEGVLGVTQGTDITLIDGWNWFMGAEGSSIGADQYDFQTVVTHEICHTLGIGHSNDTSSVMYPYLAPRDIRRDLSVQDLILIQQELTLISEATQVSPDEPEALLAQPPAANSLASRSLEVPFSVTPVAPFVPVGTALLPNIGLGSAIVESESRRVITLTDASALSNGTDVINLPIGNDSFRKTPLDGLADDNESVGTGNSHDERFISASDDFFTALGIGEIGLEDEVGAPVAFA